MSIDNVQQLLSEQLGKRTVDIINGAETITSKDYYAIHFLADTVVSAMTIGNDSGIAGDSTPAALHRTYTAGTTLFLNVTAITTSSGLAIAYYELNNR
ncbi:MAG: hypothetical protein Unbinned6316contig1000_41 [Prokaryotic dsDNA virus sp.]|nr:MAG: hypothetical protein Unbinned6316contig1000_41 [Prokaryotic dsDNA virus sp.]|tara:strand:- start:9855 stop:10148 length:294 start_codon:yes stop_codon:yes gene_type:complete